MPVNFQQTAGGAGPAATTDGSHQQSFMQDHREDSQHHGHDTVDVGFFDPEGVQELGRQITRESASRAATAVGHPSVDDSEYTLTFDEKFDFGKLARGIMRK